jgi:N-acetylglucosamine-6-phosphate deacetylase
MVQAAFRLFGAERIVLISDSTRAAGCPDGTYELGGQLVEKRDGAAWLTEDTLAGSAVSLFDCLRTVAGMGIPLADAVRAAAWNPAVSIGAEKECGAIAPGMPARILLVAESLDLVRVITEEDC